MGAPTRSPLVPPRRGPEPARRGGYRRPFGRPPPHATERVRLPRRQAREFADATKPASRFPESDAGRATRVRRALPPPPFAPPGGLTPLSTRAVPAAPLSVQAGTPRRHAKELRKAASIQAQHKHQCRLADAERARVAEEARRKAMVQKAHQLGTGQPLRLPASARDHIQAQEAKHARRRAKEDRRKASHARGAAAVTPVLAAAAALAAAEAVPRQRMPGESGPAYRRPSRGEEPDWPGQPEGARASAREPLGTLWW